MNNRVFPLALAVVLLTLGTAKADPTIGFSLDGINFLTTFNITNGDSITVGVYARSAGDTRIPDNGLQNFGTSATYGTTLGNVTGVGMGAGFSDLGSTFNNGTGEMLLRGLTSNILSPPTGTDLQFAEFTFMSTGVGMTSFTFDDATPITGSSFTDGNGNDLDPSIFGGTTYTVTINAITAIPEPSIFGLAILGCAAFGFRRVRSA